MHRIPRFPIASLPFLLACSLACPAAEYVPHRHDWERIDAAGAGFDAGQLEDAIAFARESAETEPSDLHQVITDAFAPREPDFRILGPTRPRAGDSGMVLRGRRIVAEWGDVP